MLSFFIIFSVCLATYAVNADNRVLDNDGKPDMLSRLQKTQNMVGKNNVFSDLKTNDNLGNIQTAGRGLGTPTSWYENSATDNFQTIPQQNNRANNRNNRSNRRQRRRNNRNNNRKNSQSYVSPSPSPPQPSPFSSDWNNYWANFQPVVEPPPQPTMLSPFNNNFQPVRTPPITYPPQFNGFNNYNNGNFDHSSYNNFQPIRTPPIPYPPPPPQFNGFNSYNNGNFDHSSYSPNIVINDDGVFINGKLCPTDSESTQGISVNYNDVDGYTVNGKRIPLDEMGNPLNEANVDSSGKKLDNLKPFETPPTPYPPQQQQHRCILYKGLSNTNNNCYYDGSPNIYLYDDGVVINGKKIQMDVGNTEAPIVKFNKKDGFTVNGRKVPADAEGNPLIPAHVDNIQPTGLNNRYQPDKDLRKKGQTVNTNDNVVTVNGKKVQGNLVANEGYNVDMTGDGNKINGNEVTGDKVGNQGLIPDFQKGKPKTNEEKVSKDVIVNKLNRADYSKKKLDMPIDGINGKEVTKDVIGNKGITVNRTDDGLLVNGKKVPGVNANDRLVIDYDEEGITVNGVRKEGFKDIKGKGRKVLGSRLNPTHLDAVESTTDNNIQNSKSRKGGQQRNRQKQQQVNN